MIRKPVLKSILMGMFSCTLAISLSACDNESSSETSAAQALPSSSTNDTPAPETTASTTEAPAPEPTGTVSSTQTAPPPAPVATDTTPTPTTTAPAPTNTSGSAAAAARPFPGGGILWKPVSHGFGGRLVVLIPPSVAQASTPIRILDADGNTIDQGNYHNAHGENGGRHHFVFGRTGSAYPSPSILSIGGANYLIPNPGGRYE